MLMVVAPRCRVQRRREPEVEGPELQGLARAYEGRVPKCAATS